MELEPVISAIVSAYLCTVKHDSNMSSYLQSVLQAWIKEKVYIATMYEAVGMKH